MASTGPGAAAPGPHPMHEPGPVVGSGQAFLHTMELCLGPAVFMLVMSFAVFCRKPSQVFVSMMQHFGAGIVLSAVATELLPAMSSQAHKRSDKASATLATIIGFFLGVAMMVGVAHFCGEPEHDDEEEEEVEEEAAEMGGHLGEAQADATGSTAHSSIIPSPPRRLREVWTTHGGGGGGAASSPNRGGGGSMMQRSMSMGRRKTLMETYRAAALEASSPIPISGSVRQQLRQQQQQQQQQQSLSSSAAAQAPNSATNPNERTALLRRAYTASAATGGNGGGNGNGGGGGGGATSLGSNGGSSGADSPPPAPLAATVSGLEAAQRKERLAHKYDENDSGGDEEAGGLLSRPRARRSSSASSSGQSGRGAAAAAAMAVARPKGGGNGGGHKTFGVGGGPLVVRSYGPVPWTLVVPVYVDSFMDGLLIGLSAVAGQSAGLVMAVALTIEMGFLGLTFSAGIGKIRPALRYALVVGAPLMILVGGAIGALAAAALSANPIMQVGLIAFGVAALLYLVTEELLVEAHEGGEPHVWYIDMMFFVGFIASVLLEQTVHDQELQQQAKEQAAQMAAAVVAAAVAKCGGDAF